MGNGIAIFVFRFHSCHFVTVSELAGVEKAVQCKRQITCELASGSSPEHSCICTGP